MEESGIVKNDTFKSKKVPQGSEKSALGESCVNQMCRHLNTMKLAFNNFSGLFKVVPLE